MGSKKVAHNDIIVGCCVEQSIVYGCYEYMSVIIVALRIILFFLISRILLSVCYYLKGADYEIKKSL